MHGLCTREEETVSTTRLSQEKVINANWRERLKTRSRSWIAKIKDGIKIGSPRSRLVGYIGISLLDLGLLTSHKCRQCITRRSVRRRSSTHERDELNRSVVIDPRQASGSCLTRDLFLRNFNSRPRPSRNRQRPNKRQPQKLTNGLWAFQERISYDELEPGFRCHLVRACVVVLARLPRCGS